MAFDFEYQEHQNFLGLLRESMLVSNYKKYFEKSFTGGWSGLSDDADERFFEKLGIKRIDVGK